MAGNIKLIKADVTRSAAKIEAAADHVHGIDMAGVIGEIGGALPSSTSAAAAKSAGAKLQHDRDAWVKEGHSHHRLTMADVANIEKADESSGEQGRQHLKNFDDNMPILRPKGGPQHSDNMPIVHPKDPDRIDGAFYGAAPEGEPPAEFQQATPEPGPIPNLQERLGG